MLANLAMRDFDKLVSTVCDRHGLTYTRYADDLTLSTQQTDFSREKGRKAIGEVYSVMGQFGLSPNATKTRIVTPGSRKIVLGLLVDGSRPKLPKDFKASMRQHLYYLGNPKVGPATHARNRGFSSVAGMKNHLFGLASFANQIEPDYGYSCLASLKSIDWPT
jgi:hypothetical protein